MAEKTRENTLAFDPEACNRCGMCAIVCPHRVFSNGDAGVSVVDRDACMECGACALNCRAGAIKVDSGVGCATAMMLAALTGRKTATCC